MIRATFSGFSTAFSALQASQKRLDIVGQNLSNMNTPLPMVVIGYQLSQADFRRALHGASFWVSAALRLVILPLLALGVCMLMRLDSGVTLAVVIAASTPPAALLGMFAAKFDKDVSLAPSLVAVQTLLSMITMPLVLGLAKFLV